MGFVALLYLSTAMNKAIFRRYWSKRSFAVAPQICRISLLVKLHDKKQENRGRRHLGELFGIPFRIEK